MTLVELRPAGLYCPSGDFYIDPWTPVDRTVVTHAHTDRAVPGSQSYLTSAEGAALLAESLGDAAAMESLPYGEKLVIGDCAVSLHPAGHMLGAAQVRIERGGEVCVVSGDYQLAPDPTCARFEPLVCDAFVTESTYALPIFRWPEPAATVAAIESWRRSNQEAGRAGVLFANPLGMAQRLLAMLEGPIQVHDEIERFSRHYRAAGIALPLPASEGLVLAPPSAAGSPWMKRYSNASTAMVSGWMRLRGPRRRRSLDRGFVLSSHADWPALLAAIAETRAENIWATGGHRASLVRWLNQQGRSAAAVEAHFADDET